MDVTVSLGVCVETMELLFDDLCVRRGASPAAAAYIVVIRSEVRIC